MTDRARSFRSWVPGFLAVFFLLAGAGPARGDELASWLEKTPSTERWEKEVIEHRRDPGFAAALLAAARDEKVPEPARKRALVLLGAVEDRAEAAKDVAPLDAAAAARIEERASLIARLRDEKELLPTPSVAREALALARDPLFEGRARLVPFLPALAKTAKADLATILAAIVQQRGPGGEVRARVLALAAAGPNREELARLVAGAIDDPDPLVAARAADALLLVAASSEKADPNVLDDPLSIFAGLALAPSAPLERRTRAVEALGRTRSLEAAHHVEDAFRQAVPITEDRLRVASLVALGRTGGRPTLEIATRLFELLSSASSDSQDRAIDGLGELPAPVVESVLRPKLKDPSSDQEKTRAAQASRALALLGLAPDLILLVRAETASPAARTAAIRALEVAGDPRDGAAAVGLVLATARDSPEAASLRRAAALALGSSQLRGDAARAALAQAVHDEASIVRLAALRALGAQGDARALEPLLALVGKQDLAARERAQAIRALDHLGIHDDSVAKKVSEAVEEDPAPDVAIAGAEFLASAARSVAIPALIRLLESADVSVRERAHASLLARTEVSIHADLDPFGYDPSVRATAAERAEKVKKWREWWEYHRDR